MGAPILGDQQFVPNALTPNYISRFFRDPVSGLLSTQFSTDGGNTWGQMAAQPPSGVGAGWVPTWDGINSIVWKPISSLIGIPTQTSGGTTQSWAEFQYPAALSTGNQFGYFQVPSGTTLSCYGAQASVFTPSTGADIVVYLVQIVSGIPQVQSTSFRLTQNSLSVSSIFSQPITMTPNTSWALILSSVGTTEPGEFLSCRLLFNTSE